MFKTVYHGTSREAAQDIVKNGVDIMKGHGGYFGWAFYTTEDKQLAKSNYADFAGDCNGVVLEFKVKSSATILDLRKPEDWERYLETDHESFYHSIDGSFRLVDQFGIDAIYDTSNDSLMVFNPTILEVVK